jgi:predicted Ser/Thr protein kinase
VPLDPENDATVVLPKVEALPKAHAFVVSKVHADTQRFAPGTLLASRYRIIARLGKGGMGEVFRAEDIMLGQPVALKFLPENARGNLNLLTRFYDEVRIARQISHANVCRVYDIGEIEGQPYLSMEYIDGEDLASLLRRIGRLPGDKAAELARKMCAGLAAAHAQGVLHRDIKPGNIMIDGRGEPRITDFGLAAVASAIEGREIRNGTPAYMAPEQLEGREVTVQSDLYALGLVFHEMFTGKAAHEAETVAELTTLRKSAQLSKSSTLVGDLDPAVERAMQACLHPDPAARPKSALELARMLPGGDPLAAALAAGQTPSPELVAASGSTDALEPRKAALMVVAVIVGMAGLMALIRAWGGPISLPLQYPPDVLVDRARHVLRVAGYTQPAADSAWNFTTDADFSAYMLRFVKRRKQWAAIFGKHPTEMHFWYREALRPFAPNGDSLGSVNPANPPLLQEGMTRVESGLAGELIQFNAVPPQHKAAVVSATPIDWRPFFELAKLDMAKFSLATPEWTSPTGSDARVAWTGVLPMQYETPGDVPLRVEAASFGGRPVYFHVVYPWLRATRDVGMAPPQTSLASRIGSVVRILIALVAGLMAFVHWKTGRGDRKGAWRTGIIAGTLVLAQVLLSLHYNSNVLSHVQLALGVSLFWALVTWALYLSIEPWVRRYWPESLVSWTRLLQGKTSDPLVGRHVLLGLLLAPAFGLFLVVRNHLLNDALRAESSGVSGALLMGTNMVLNRFLNVLLNSVILALGLLFLLFVLRILLRKEWLAMAAMVAIGGGMQAAGGTAPFLYSFPFQCASYLCIGLALRKGVLPGVVLIFAIDLMDNFVTTDFAAWYGQSSWMAPALLVALAVWSYRTAVNGQPLFASAKQ